jgi:hypothetical protein
MPDTGLTRHHSYDEGLPVLASMPAYFKNNGYHLPCSSNDGPLQYAYGTNKDSYSYWSTEKPSTMANFNIFMQGLFGTPQRLGWTDWFPLEEVCFDGFDGSKSPYLFVDVAGGKGHECDLLLRKHPKLQGKLVLEELPFVIDDISDLDIRVERVKHDFTTPQPVQGELLWKTCVPAYMLTSDEQVLGYTSCRTSCTTGRRRSVSIS